MSCLFFPQSACVGLNPLNRAKMGLELQKVSGGETAYKEGGETAYKEGGVKKETFRPSY